MHQPFKSLWRKRYQKVWSFLCPLCRTPRRLPFRPQPGGFRHYFQVGLSAGFFALVFWKVLGWKGFVSFVPFWTVFEIVYRWRVRAALSCANCGFDPYLFRVDVQLARREVEAHWQKKLASKGIPHPSSPVRSSSVEGSLDQAGS